jgi:hypothetical protein
VLGGTRDEEGGLLGHLLHVRVQAGAHRPCVRLRESESGPGGLTREVETPLPLNSPHDHMILRVDLEDSHGRRKRPRLQTTSDANGHPLYPTSQARSSLPSTTHTHHLTMPAQNLRPPPRCAKRRVFENPPALSFRLRTHLMMRFTRDMGRWSSVALSFASAWFPLPSGSSVSPASAAAAFRTASAPASASAFAAFSCCVRLLYSCASVRPRPAHSAGSGKHATP